MSYRDKSIEKGPNAPRLATFGDRNPIYTAESSSRTPARPAVVERQPVTAQDGDSNPQNGVTWEEFDDWDSDLDEMEDRRPPLHRPTDGRSAQPLLHKEDEERGRTGYDESADTAQRPSAFTRRSTLRSRSPDTQAKMAAKKKYTYAAFFLLLSLITFTVQTETAVYIQHELKWDKAYCMLYVISNSQAVVLLTNIHVLQVLHSWILGSAMAVPTPCAKNSEVEHAMEDILATTYLSCAYDSSDGRDTKPSCSARTAVAMALLHQNDMFYHLRFDYRRRILVCGGKPDFAIRSYRNLQLLGLLCLRLLRATAQGETPLG